MNILLLQGPLGPFYQTLAAEFSDAGHQVYKINFNAGDRCWRITGHQQDFKGQSAEWADYLRRYLKLWHIDTVICYGDCRFYHQQAGVVCKQLNITFWALEEGYLRPDFITMELGGVNANSGLFKQKQQLIIPCNYPPYIIDFVAGKTFFKRVFFALRYFFNKRLGQHIFMHAEDHRPWTPAYELWSWIKGGLIKFSHKKCDTKLMKNLSENQVDNLFLVPLQVSEDFQIRQHSNYVCVEQMIAEVIESFAAHALKSSQLIFKHHPMDRGYVSYKKQIERLIHLHNLQGRVHYGYELPLPELYPLLTGVVTINSTVGLSALLHNVPTLCLGEALYDIPSLTSQVNLDEFWHYQDVVCPDAFAALKQNLLHLTQINASFYTDMHIAAGKICRKVEAHQQLIALNENMPQRLKVTA